MSDIEREQLAYYERLRREAEGRGESRSLVNYLTGTVPEDPWWMYVYNVAILAVCLALFAVIGVESAR